MKASERLPILRLFTLLLFAAWAHADDSPSAPETITESTALLRLTVEEAAKAYPVDITGVVTYFGPDNTPEIEGYHLFVHDGTANIYVQLNPDDVTEPLQTGHSVRITGVTDPGGYAPTLLAHGVEILGKAPLPEPKNVRLGHIYQGRMAGEWVELEGRVRMAIMSDKFFVMDVGLGPVRLESITPITESIPPPEQAIGAWVRMRGVVGVYFNKRRQLIEDRLFVSSMEDIEWVMEGPANPFEDALTDIARIGRYDPDRALMHYVRIQGTLTYAEPFGRCYVQDNTGGIMVETLIPTNERIPGQRVEVVGIPTIRDGNVLIASSIVTTKAQKDLPAPKVVTPTELLAGDQHARLVAVEGEVLRSGFADRGAAVSLIGEDVPFECYFTADDLEAGMRKLRPGNRVLLSGVCEIVSGSRPQSSLMIRVQGADNITVVREASWWTPQRLALGLIAILGIALLTGGGVIYLQRKVNEQTQEITTRLQRESSLERRLERMFHGMPDPLLVTDMNGMIHEVNHATELQYGLDRGELIGQRIELLIGPESRHVFDEFLSSLASDQIAQKECPNRKADGAIFIAEWNARRVDINDEPLVLIQVRDLTERRSLEAQLIQSQKMETIGRLASGVAHDFNNLLMVLRGGADMLSECNTLSDDESQIVRMMDKSIMQASQLTKQLLTFSRRDKVNKDNVDLNSVVEAIARLLERIKPDAVTIRVLPNRAALTAIADANLLEQVLLNLAVNAFDAMPDGGVLTLQTSKLELEAVNPAHAAAPAGRYCCLTVRDTGKGIYPAVMDRIFEPFFSTKDIGKGTGLGLSIVYGIIEQHRGWIEVDSEPGNGTEFRLYLPHASNNPESPVD
ncbi:MAG: two-component system sensor histidine kinase NtrB [Puniceicoccales bacterium]